MLSRTSQLAIILISLYFLAACSTSESDQATSGQTANPTNFLETWVYIDTGNELLLSENTSGKISVLDDNLISITDSEGQIRHLLRSGINNVTVSALVTNHGTATISAPTAKISRNLQANKGTAGIAGINVILQNINQGPAVTTSTDSSGQISTSVPTGTYEITSEDSNGNTVEATVTVNGEETDIGTLTLVDPQGYNFKVELIMDKDYVYGDFQTYTGKIRVHNIGSIEGTGLSFNVGCADVYIQTCVVDNVLGSISSGGYKDIPISVSFKFLDDIRYKLSLPVTITDVNYKQWSDPAMLTVYKNVMRVNIKSSDSYVKGFLIVPGRNLIRINTQSNTIKVPYQPDKQYKLLIANPSISGETAYSVGIDTAVLDLTNFTDTGSYEPNNSETQAQSLAPKSAITSYLHSGDLDYYTINMPALSGLAPVDLAYHSRSALYDADSSSYGTAGNNDSILNAGETARFSIALENTGTSTAMDVLISLDTTDPYLTITNVASDTARTVTFGTGEIRDSDIYLSTSSLFNGRSAINDFSVSADLTTPMGHVATVNITMTDRYGNTWIDSFELTVEGIAASIAYHSRSALYDADSSSYGTAGNNDSILNAGETARFSIALENTGTSTAMDVLISLDTTDPYLTITNVASDTARTVTFGTGEIRDSDIYLSTSSLFNGRSAINDFSVSADLTTPMGHVATVNITMTDRYGNTWIDSFTLTVQ